MLDFDLCKQKLLHKVFKLNRVRNYSNYTNIMIPLLARMLNFVLSHSAASSPKCLKEEQVCNSERIATTLNAMVVARSSLLGSPGEVGYHKYFLLPDLGGSCCYW